MARFYFYLSNDLDTLPDLQGLDFPDLETAKQHALAFARDALCDEIRDGVLDLRYCIEVKDEAGRIVHRLPMENAIEIVMA